MTTAFKRLFLAFELAAAATLTTACASIGKIENQPLAHIPDGPHGYSLEKHAQGYERGETELVLAFSGGGTRAAALSYGVLKELRDTKTTLTYPTGYLSVGSLLLSSTGSSRKALCDSSITMIVSRLV